MSPRAGIRRFAEVTYLCGELDEDFSVVMPVACLGTVPTTLWRLQRPEEFFTVRWKLWWQIATVKWVGEICLPYFGTYFDIVDTGSVHWLQFGVYPFRNANSRYNGVGFEERRCPCSPTHTRGGTAAKKLWTQLHYREERTYNEPQHHWQCSPNGL
jgi:hypothetical protein